MEPRFNGRPKLQLGCKMYGIKPRYNEPRYTEFFDITNIIQKPKRKIYPLDITNYNVNTREEINVNCSGFYFLASTIFCFSFVTHRTQLARREAEETLDYIINVVMFRL